MSLIAIEAVSKSFGSNLVLRQVTLDVAPGEVVALIGRSGSGKSTLLRCINGLETLDAGRIVVDDVCISQDRRELRALRLKVGMVFQQFNLFPHLSARHNVMLPLQVVKGMRGDEAEAIAHTMLERVGMAHKASAFPDQLSGGQQQRVAIARWHHVRATLDGQGQPGFIVDGFADTRFKWTTGQQPTLRDPSSPAREALVASAIAQWFRFDRGEGKESTEKFSAFIAQMWKAFGKNLTGHDDVPWSAVAISQMVRDAAASFPAYAKFPESIGHARYMWRAIQAESISDTSAVFWGKRLADAKPEVGDTIGSWREKPSSYDRFLAASKNPESPSHCDIVVAVGPEVALAIGGNVQNSVYATGYELTPAGFFTLNQRFIKNPPPNGAGRLVGEAIVLMKNRAG